MKEGQRRVAKAFLAVPVASVFALAGAGCGPDTPHPGKINTCSTRPHSPYRSSGERVVRNNIPGMVASTQYRAAEIADSLNGGQDNFPDGTTISVPPALFVTLNLNWKPYDRKNPNSFSAAVPPTFNRTTTVCEVKDSGGKPVYEVTNMAQAIRDVARRIGFNKSSK